MATIATERLKHIDCASRRLIHGDPVAAIARRFKVSERTVYLWTALALTYPEFADYRRPN